MCLYILRCFTSYLRIRTPSYGRKQRDRDIEVDRSLKVIKEKRTGYFRCDLSVIFSGCKMIKKSITYETIAIERRCRSQPVCFLMFRAHRSIALYPSVIIVTLTQFPLLKRIVLVASIIRVSHCYYTHTPITLLSCCVIAKSQFVLSRRARRGGKDTFVSRSCVVGTTSAGNSQDNAAAQL